MKRALHALLTGGLVALSASCAQDVGDINRVQPNYTSKNVFNGIWYFRQTVTQVPYENSAMLFEGIGGEMEKIRWEVTEKALIAYRTYEFIPGANGAGAKEASYDGQPVAAWPIQSHFDVQRGYNPATGEVTNVISENSSDRPWYERDYVRVDWSTNLINNTSSIDTFMQYVSASSANYYIPENETDNPDRAEVGSDSINIVNKYNVAPDNYSCYVEFNDWFQPGSGACSASTIKMRSSFLRVDDRRPTYEPLAYPNVSDLTDTDGSPLWTVTLCTKNDGQNCVKQAEFACDRDFMGRLANLTGDRNLTPEQVGCQPKRQEYFAKFGYFRTERITYDRDYGHTDSGRVFLANRWNMWQQSYAADGSGALQPIPVAQRQVKPIVYHLNVGFPEGVKSAAYETGEEWNNVFKSTLRGMGYPEAQIPEKVFEIRDNSCTASSVQAFASANGYAGVVDGVTGRGVDGLTEGNLPRVCAALESASAAAAQANAAAPRFTWQKAGDLRYSFLYWVDNPQLSGPLGFGPSSADPETGEIINANAYMYGGAVDTYARASTDLILALNGDLKVNDILKGTQVKNLVRRNSEEARRLAATSVGANTERVLAERLRRNGHSKAERRENGTKIAAGWHDARLERVRGTALEREKLLSDDVLRLSPRYNRGEGISDAVLNDASPATWASNQRSLERKARMNKFLKNCLYLAEFADDSILGLALSYKQQGKSADEIWADLRNEIFKAVALHEVGHTLGLRHNFEGSTDALNYFDEFWDIQEAQQTTEGRVQARQPEFKYSTIMDYGAKFNSDFHGLGKYDYAAIKFGYGQTLEVFDPSVPAPSADQLDMRMRYFDDYSKLPSAALLGSKENLRKRQDVAVSQRVSDTVAGVKANTAGLRNYPNARDLIVLNFFGSDQQLDVDYSAPFAAQSEVPFRFCTDDWESSTPTCRVWDEGANQRESMTSVAEAYKNYYIWSAFKRDRFNFDPWSYMDRLYGRYFKRFVETFQEFYFDYAYFFDGDLSGDFMKDLAAGSIIGLNTLAGVFQTPEPGYYCRVFAQEPQWADTYTPEQVTYLRDLWEVNAGRYVSTQSTAGQYVCEDDTLVNVPVGVGRGFYMDWENNGGQWWRPVSTGAFYERLAALQAITQSETNFVAADTGADRRRWTISFYRLFQNELIDLFGGLISDDLASIAGTIDDNGQFVNRPLVTEEQFAARERGDNTNGASLVLPRSSPDLRWYASLFGMALFTSTIDQQMDFGRYVKVSLKGSNDDIAYPDWMSADDTFVTEVTDPFTHFTYRAVQTADNRGIGYKLVKNAQAAVDRYNESKARLDIMDPADPAYQDQRRIVDNYGSRVAFHVEMMDDIRLFQQVFGFGQ